MSLDPHPSPGRIREMLAEKEARHRGIVLGPGSPLRKDPRPREPRERAPLKANAGPTEHQLQVALFEWIDEPTRQLEYPELAYAFAVPNGGKRMPGVAAKLKAEGVKRGVPDVWLPVRRRDYIGLVIEMKQPGRPTTPEQADWLAALARQGWKTALHTTTETATAEILNYLTLPR